ncbi:MAG: hypothetical protein GY868_19550, partial [Deltaproteobacteria bacterium]|nr:hypothetical protein [Deltaproteobacteria bacterium]
PKTVMLLFTLLALAFPLCSILEKFYPNGFSMLLYAASSIWLGVLFLLLTAFLLYEPLRFFIKPNAHRGLVIVGIVALVSLYALIMGQLIFTKRVDIRLANLTGPVSIAHLSDVHVGTIHNSGYLARVVEKTNNLNPDLVVITGDFFDGLGPVNQHTVAPLANISAPAYFVIGNHERYSDMQRVVELMSGAGVTTLRNRVIETH